MKPGRYNFRIVQGDTFTSSPAWKINSSYVNVTGYTGKMQVRRASNSSTVLLELSNANGRITTGGSNGTFTLTADSTTTAALPTGEFVYDFEITAPDATKTTLLTGAFTVVAQVTT